MNMTESTSAPLASHVARRWSVKIGLIALAITAFGLFGVYDAVKGYPDRGKNAAEAAEYQYLQQLGADHMDYRASITDPALALADLTRNEATAPLSPADHLEKAWLEQLDRVHKIEPASASTIIPRTDFRGDKVTDAAQRRAELQKRWTTTAGGLRQASPLTPWDILLQWVIVAVCLPIGLWMFLLMMVAKSRVYRWDPSEQRLTLPGGQSFVPSDIAEVDKRKWHRLYVTLKMKPSHPQLGGRDVELDLLRYEPVEDWVLAMERTAFPEHAEKAPEPAPAPAHGG
jgi:hypothetical protein